jgi:hypothetical protein
MTDTPGRALWRVVRTLGVYALVAGAVWLMVPSIQRVFLLPQLFRPLIGAMLLSGIPVAVAVAWRYPRLGAAESEDG